MEEVKEIQSKLDILQKKYDSLLEAYNKQSKVCGNRGDELCSLHEANGNIYELFQRNRASLIDFKREYPILRKKYDDLKIREKQIVRVMSSLRRELSEYRMILKTRHFPIRSVDPYEPATVIPWWLAEIAYEYYIREFSSSQSLDQLAEKGGFDREMLLRLLRRNL